VQIEEHRAKLDFGFLTAADEIDGTRPGEGYEERYHLVKYVIDLSETSRGRSYTCIMYCRATGD
jgi:hypothetical protein